MGEGMKTAWMAIWCIGMVACATQHKVEPMEIPPQLRAVITNYDSGGATIQCVLNTWVPVDHVWQSIIVTESASDERLAHTVLQQMENILSAGHAEVEDHNLLTGVKHRYHEATKEYISTAQLYVAGIDEGSRIRLSISIDHKQIQTELREQNRAIHLAPLDD